MTIEIVDGLCFDDVLLVPKYSDIKSRSDINLQFKVEKNDFKVTYNHPIIPANMKNIMGLEMARAIFQSGGLGFLHRFDTIENQNNILSQLKNEFGSEALDHIGVSIGVKDEDKQNIDLFIEKGIKIICIDIAHGHSKRCVEMTNWIYNNYPDVLLIAGNVATEDGAICLWQSGADFVKVNIGAGSLCTTRIVTGNGVPQLTALIDVARARKRPLAVSKYKFCGIIADGGAKNIGDLVKSLSCADLVMTGNMFAGCPETPSENIIVNDILYKKYAGSSTYKATHIEGVEAMVPCKEPHQIILNKMLEGIRSGMSYQNASNLKELQNNPKFVRMTNAGLIESHPHDVMVIKS